MTQTGRPQRWGAARLAEEQTAGKGRAGHEVEVESEETE